MKHNEILGVDINSLRGSQRMASVYSSGGLREEKRSINTQCLEEVFKMVLKDDT